MQAFHLFRLEIRPEMEVGKLCSVLRHRLRGEGWLHKPLLLLGCVSVLNDLNCFASFSRRGSGSIITYFMKKTKSVNHTLNGFMAISVTGIFMLMFLQPGFDLTSNKFVSFRDTVAHRLTAFMVSKSTIFNYFRLFISFISKDAEHPMVRSFYTR